MDAVLKRLMYSGLTLSLKKCRFNQKENEFFGLTFSKAGVNLKELKARSPAQCPYQEIHLNSIDFVASQCDVRILLKTFIFNN